jgi:hypothetical protein
MKGNKGEWSEAYTFLKLLSDRKLHGADKDLNKVKDLTYPLIKIIRYEQDNEIIEYIPNENAIQITSIGTNSTLPSNISGSLISKMTSDLLHELKSNKLSSFEIPYIQKGLEQLGYYKLKSKSSKKSDISIVIHDSKTGYEPLLHFSIKSKLGNPSTLFNSNKNSTNFKFSLAPKLSTLTVDNINTTNYKAKIKDRVSAIYDQGSSLEFNSVIDDIFQTNLQLIDSQMPLILGELLLGYYKEKISDMNKLTSYLTTKNPCGFNLKYNHNFYEYKIKNFLMEVALGMTSKSVWNGYYDATGGYLIVREDGEIVCFHIFNKNDFQDYLFANTFLDTPSSTRHNFGSIYLDDKGNQHFNLNLLIRFR